MRERIALPTLIALVLIFSPILLPPVSSEPILGEFIKLDEMGVEVLLNSFNASYDPIRLDELAEEGELNVMDEKMISGDPWSATDREHKRYLMRNIHDDRIGVVMGYVNNTKHIEEFDASHTLEGLSINLIIPGDLEFVELNYTIYDIVVEEVDLDLKTFGDDLADIGLNDVQSIQINDSETIFNSYKNEYQITIRVFSSDSEDGHYDVVVHVEAFDDLVDSMFFEKLSVLLEFLGREDIDPEEHVTEVESRFTNLLRTHEHMDPDDIDWNEAMRSQLDWLVLEGVISGISDEDITEISDLAKIGRYGYLKRIIYYNPTESWTTYDETGLPMNWLNFGGIAETYPDELFPDRSDDHTVDHDGYYLSAAITIIAISFILVPLGSLLLYRTKRAVDINNGRRRLIYDTIRENPGIHFRAIMDRLDLKPGVTSYHINKLEKMELIKSYQDGMYRKFFLYDEKVDMKIALSDLQSLIVNVIQEEPGISQIDISRTIGKSKVVVNYHVRFLRDLGLLFVERDGRRTHCFLTEKGIEIRT